MSNIDSARRALIARIVDGEGEAPQAQRRAAFDNNTGLAEPVHSLVAKISERAHTVTDDDVARVLASGLSEDQLFELAVCAAVGQATRQYDVACAALQAAIERQ